MVMTMPDLETYFLKRSKVQKPGLLYNVSNMIKRGIFFSVQMTRPSFISLENFTHNIFKLIPEMQVERTLISPHVRIHSHSHVEDSVLMDGVDVGRGARVRRAIIDKGVRIQPDCVIGEDIEADRRRFAVTPNGVVVIAQNTTVE